MTERNRKKRKRLGALIVVLVLFTVILAGAIWFVYWNCHSDKEEFRKAGITAMKNGSYEIALSDFEKSLNEKQWFTGDMDLDTKMYIGSCYLHLGRYEDAAKLYRNLSKEQSSAIDSSAVKAMLDMAEANLLIDSIGSNDISIPDDAMIATLLEKTSSDSGLYLYLASAYNRRKEYDKAEAAVECYLKDHPMNSYTAYEISSMYLREKNTEAARPVIEEGLAAPDGIFRDLLLYNQVMLLESAGEYEKAYEQAKKLHEQYPENKDMERAYSFLDSRVNPDTTPVNPFSDAIPEEEWEAIRQRIDSGQ